MTQTWLYIIAMVVVLLSALNQGLSVFLGPVSPTIRAILGILTGLAGLYLAFNRDTYLPFLSRSVYPCGLLADKVPDGATHDVVVRVPAGAKVVYWAAEPSNQALTVSPDPWTAYVKYENAGVVTADRQGVAVLKVREPTSYRVPSGVILKRHIHYRYCVKAGLLSRVETAFLDV